MTTVEDSYRKRIEFDSVAHGSHCVDCYPGACPYRVYVKDGKIIREEVTGTLPTFEEGVPDMNPLGCQKGAAWSQQLDSEDRLLHPMRRVGERGSGQWERITWDEALGEIANSIVDAIEEDGPESIIHEGTPEVVVAPAVHRFMRTIGGVITDINGSINDLALGHHLTFGRFYPIGSNDDIFHSELLILWHTNPAYTCIPFFHYLSESRYHGGEIVLFSPDVSPSHSHVDYHVPVEWGSDPALALSMCQVILEEGLADEDFIKTQTDLSLLIRKDRGTFLRESELREGGDKELFYHLVKLNSGFELKEASKTELLTSKVAELTGSYKVKLIDGSEVEVEPLYEKIKRTLNEEYTPEMTQSITTVNPDLLRQLSRKVATKKTKILMGMGACKAYHSDLYQRTMNLLLGISGNWGKKGTGINCWAIGLFDGQTSTMVKERPGVAGADDVFTSMAEVEKAMMDQDPSLDEVLASIELWRQMAASGGRAMFPAFFLWYFHEGHRERWNNKTFNDPKMIKSFDDYLNEAIGKGWYDGLVKPGPETNLRVLIECGSNMLRRTRGGRRVVIDSLFNKLKLIVTVDVRMSVTGLNSDILLPAAQHYEKVNFHLPSPSMLILQLSDKAAEPPGEAKDEWEIFAALSLKISQVAAERGLEKFDEGKDLFGQEISKSYAKLWDNFTLNGYLLNYEDVGNEMVRDTAYSGTLPEATTLETLRKDGWIKFKEWGISPMAKGQSSPFPENETHSPFRDHIERGTPYPTLTRRAQFLIEHDWFFDAGEDIPVHKSPPLMGGDHYFKMSGGHNRWSIHAMNMGNKWLLETHRGEPHAVMHPNDAKELGISDNDFIEVSNDVGEYKVRVKLSSSQRPSGLTIYNGWDSHMFKNHDGSNEVEPGMVKWLNMAGGYGHLRYAPMEWQPAPVDRPIYVSIKKAG